MSKLAALTGAVLLSTGLAVSPALAKRHHHHHAVTASEPAVMVPAPLIAGSPIRVGSNCYTVRNGDWGVGYAMACPKKK